MKTNFKNAKLNFAVILIIAFFLLSGCGDSSDSGDSHTSEIAATFNAANANKIQQSIIDLPTSLTGSSPSQSIQMSSSRSVSSEGGGGDNNGGMEGIYSGIQHYVKLVEEMKNMIEDMIYEILSAPDVKTAELGQPLIIPEDPEDPEAPRKIILEKFSENDPTEDYMWKVSLFADEDDQTPDIIVRFTLEGLGAKGRVLLGMSEQDEDLRDVGIDVTIDRNFDLVFDGTVSPQTLEVKVVQDLTHLRSYADSNWGGLSEASKDALDLGQPDKVFLSSSYNGSEFTIYGTSYHPGWKKEAELKGEDMMFGAKRTMYMFKAKANGTGAKLYLALPEETRSTITGLWTQDSIGNIFTEAMLNQFNDMIAKLADATDDSGDGGENPSVFEEQKQAVFVMCWMLGSSVCETMASHGPTFSAPEHTNFTDYYSEPTADNSHAWLLDMTTDTTLDTFTLSDLNGLYGGLDPTGDTKKFVYIVVMLPTFKASLDASADGYSINKDQLEAFIYADSSNDYDSSSDSSDDDHRSNTQSAYSAIKYMINPAFFSADGGFLGTYDASNVIYYQFVNGTLLPTTDTTPIDALNGLDLSSINPYTPTDVTAAVITVE